MCWIVFGIKDLCGCGYGWCISSLGAPPAAPRQQSRPSNAARRLSWKCQLPPWGGPDTPSCLSSCLSFRCSTNHPFALFPRHLCCISLSAGSVVIGGALKCKIHLGSSLDEKQHWVGAKKVSFWSNLCINIFLSAFRKAFCYIFRSPHLVDSLSLSSQLSPICDILMT